LTHPFCNPRGTPRDGWRCGWVKCSFCHAKWGFRLPHVGGGFGMSQLQGTDSDSTHAQAKVKLILMERACQFALWCPCGDSRTYAKGRCRRCYDSRRHSLRRFGGRREQVLARDRFRCTARETVLAECGRLVRWKSLCCADSSVTAYGYFKSSRLIK
jgi:hypothetical protein